MYTDRIQQSYWEDCLDLIRTTLYLIYNCFVIYIWVELLFKLYHIHHINNMFTAGLYLYILQI